MGRGGGTGGPIFQEGRQNTIVLHLSYNKKSVWKKIYCPSTYPCLEWPGSNNQIENINFLFKMDSVFKYNLAYDVCMLLPPKQSSDVMDTN